MRTFLVSSSLPIFPMTKEDSQGNYVLEMQADNVSDGYHTMHELYRHRMALFAALCNYMHNTDSWDWGIEVWKSKRHSDGTIPFNDDRYFIAGISTEHGQISYHMQVDKWWDKFKVTELEKAPEYDGHNSEDVIERLLKL